MLSAAGCVVLTGGVLALPAAPVIQDRMSWLLANRIDSARLDSLARPAVSAAARGPRWPHQVAMLLAAGSALGLVHAVTGSIPTLVSAVSGSVLFWLAAGLRSDRDRDKARAELMAGVSAVVDEYAAGATETAALRAAAGVAGRYQLDFEQAAAAVISGSATEPAFSRRPELAHLAVAHAIATHTGSRLAAVLSAVREDLAADRTVRRAVAEVLAGPRASALLLAGLPVIGLVLGAAMGASPLRVLLHTGWGQTALSAGVGLDLAGLVWTASLARRASP